MLIKWEKDTKRRTHELMGPQGVIFGGKIVVQNVGARVTRAIEMDFISETAYIQETNGNHFWLVV